MDSGREDKVACGLVAWAVIGGIGTDILKLIMYGIGHALIFNRGRAEWSMLEFHLQKPVGRDEAAPSFAPRAMFVPAKYRVPRCPCSGVRKLSNFPCQGVTKAPSPICKHLKVAYFRCSDSLR